MRIIFTFLCIFATAYKLLQYAVFSHIFSFSIHSKILHTFFILFAFLQYLCGFYAYLLPDQIV